MERYEGPFICPKTGDPADDFYCCMLCDSPPEGYEGDEDSWQVACWRFNLELVDDRWVSRWKVQSSASSPSEES